MPQTAINGSKSACPEFSRDRFRYKDVLEFRGQQGESFLAFVDSEIQRDTQVLRVEFEIRGQQTRQTAEFVQWIKESLIELVECQGVKIDEHFSIKGSHCGLVGFQQREDSALRGFPALKQLSSSGEVR